MANSVECLLGPRGHPRLQHEGEIKGDTGFTGHYHTCTATRAKQNSNPLDACALLRAMLLYDAVRGHAHTSTTRRVCVCVCVCVCVVSAMHEGLCGKSFAYCAAFHLQYAQNMSVAHIMNKPALGINHADQPAASRSRLSPSQLRLNLCVHAVACVHTCR